MFCVNEFGLWQQQKNTLLDNKDEKEETNTLINNEVIHTHGELFTSRIVSHHPLLLPICLDIG